MRISVLLSGPALPLLLNIHSVINKFDIVHFHVFTFTYSVLSKGALKQSFAIKLL